MMLIIAGCSTQKNTGATRSFHATKVRYNIYFNGQLSYDEGQKAIRKAAKDDYSGVINVDPISDHASASAAAGQMDRVIEKSRKAIKLHSIKVRPKTDPKRLKNPKYKAWLKQSEFNPAIPGAWVRLGEAEFYKGEFLGAIGTFGYVEKHFTHDPDVVARCQLYIARAYCELGWMYEAEEMIRQVNPDNLKPRNAHLYSATMADLLIHQGRYREAIPHLQLAIPYEKRDGNRARYAFALGQICQREKMRDEAIGAYRKVMNLTPGEEMEFHAKLNLNILRGKTKSLNRMLLEDKNKDRKDAIYAAIADVHMGRRDTTAALEAYQLAIDSGHTQSATILLTAGDLYYGRQAYSQAQPCYTQALAALRQEDERYARVNKLSEVLSELVEQTDIVTLQDSLQTLAQLSEDSLLSLLTYRVEQERAQAKADSARNAIAARRARLDAEDERSVDTHNMIGGGSNSGEWYFYNPALIQQGKQSFRRQWGSRTLQDNWRRSSMALTPSGDELASNTPADDSSNSLSPEQSSDSLVTKPAMDQDVETYWAQIPRTPEAIALSDSLIAGALYRLIYIYRDRIDNPDMAESTLAELRRRFPADARVSAIIDENRLRERVKTDSAFVASELARIHRDDSLYTATYAAYARGEYKRVIRNTESVAVGSPNEPRFLFVRAVSIGKTQSQQAFGEALEELINRCPNSELSTMARDFIAMMGDGYTSKRSKRGNTLDDARSEQIAEKETAEQAEEQAREPRNVVVLTIADARTDAKQLLYEIALFNFSQFMIRDFDLSATDTAITISGFESMADVQWYIGLVEKDAELSEKLRRMGVTIEAQ